MVCLTYVGFSPPDAEQPGVVDRTREPTLHAEDDDEARLTRRYQEALQGEHNIVESRDRARDPTARHNGHYTPRQDAVVTRASTVAPDAFIAMLSLRTPTPEEATRREKTARQRLGDSGCRNCGGHHPSLQRPFRKAWWECPHPLSNELQTISDNYLAHRASARCKNCPPALSLPTGQLGVA